VYVVWKKRVLGATRPCEFCGDHGCTRTALIPHLVESRRVDGKVKQIHIARLPSIRSCCLRSEKAREKWWNEVDPILARYAVPEHVFMKLFDAVPPVFDDDDAWIPPPRSFTPSAAAAVLGLGWPCNANELKAAFRRKAKETHPDVGGRAEDFRAVAEAYEFLRDVLPGPLR
jgi:hypothetical protein